MHGAGTRWSGRLAGLVLAVSGTALLPTAALATSTVPASETLAGSGTPAAPHSGSPAATADLDAPQAIATDAAGDLAIADTNACQVDVVTTRRTRLLGRTMSAHHLYVVAGGSCRGRRTSRSVRAPVGVAWGNGQLFVLDRAADVVVVVNATGRLTRDAGTGHSGVPDLTASAASSPLDEPGGVATDREGNLYIADTGDCRILMVPHTAGPHAGQQMTAGHVYSIAGNGICTLADPSGPAATSSLSAPTAVSVDPAGDLYITESGRQSVDEVPAASGIYDGVAIGARDIAPIVGSGSNNTFLAQGQPATGSYAEMNYPGGTAVDPSGDLFVADGYDHAVLVVPAHDTTLWGRSLSGGDLYVAAGAVPASAAGEPAGDATQWIGPRLLDPTDVVWSGGRLVVVDAGANKVVALS